MGRERRYVEGVGGHACRTPGIVQVGLRLFNLSLASLPTSDGDKNLAHPPKQTQPPFSRSDRHEATRAVQPASPIPVSWSVLILRNGRKQQSLFLSGSLTFFVRQVKE